MYSFSITDEQLAISLRRAFLREVAGATLCAQQVAAATISIALVDDPAIHVLNRRHLAHDYPTDVLSFLLDSEEPAEPPAASAPLGTGRTIDGEVVISTDTALREAGRFGWQPEHEVALYLVHGLLHLCGHDDATAAERRAMRAREQAILKNWGLTPHYEDTAGSAGRTPAQQTRPEGR